MVALREGDLLRAARIREKLGIKHGQSLESTERFRDKCKMKTALKEKGIKVPCFKEVESAMDIISFVEEKGYPVVVKPKKGYSSISTSVLKNEEELIELLSKGLANEVIDPVLGLEVEEFIHGKMFHIDGIVHNKQVCINWPSEYLDVVVNFKENPTISGCSLKESEPLTKRLQKYVEEVLLALEGPSTYPFHAEAWHTPADEFVLCEVACRAGGGEIAEEIFQLFQCTLEKASLQWQTETPLSNKELDSHYSHHRPKVDYRVAWIYIYPKVGNRLLHIPSKCGEPWNLVYRPLETPGTCFNNRKSCADAVSSFVLKVLDHQDPRKVCQEAFDWFENNTKWEKL